MSMFDTVGRPGSATARQPNTLRKLERMNQALRHEEPDQVPISDFFWGSFTERWRRELGLPPEADPYSHYDLDWVVTVPNMDPWIRPFQTLEENAESVIVKTGFGAILHKHFQHPMPEMIAWEIERFEQLERAALDDPADPRRFFAAGDNQIAGVGDGFQRDSPPWLDTVKSLHPRFPVYGSMIEVSECLTRLVGQVNSMMWMAEHPARMGAVIQRLGAYYLAMTEAALAAGRGWLDGFVIWGDVAYKRSTFMSPAYWREHFKPWVARMIEVIHGAQLPVIYHGCGNVRAIFEDFIEIGLDAYNPLEVKAGMDAVVLRQQYGHRMAFCGNSDIQIWEQGDRAAIRREVLRKLQAAHGGGFIFQSDHSVSSSVAGATYDYIVQLVRQFGRYPLRLEDEAP